MSSNFRIALKSLQIEQQFSHRHEIDAAKIVRGGSKRIKRGRNSDANGIRPSGRMEISVAETVMQMESGYLAGWEKRLSRAPEFEKF